MFPGPYLIPRACLTPVHNNSFYPWGLVIYLIDAFIFSWEMPAHIKKKKREREKGEKEKPKTHYKALALYLVEIVNLKAGLREK